jgi:type IV secretory pathway VirD2 relaxase
MGVMKHFQMKEFEEHPERYNLDKNGEYLNCRECQERLKPNEKWDDVCLDCKMTND